MTESTTMRGLAAERPRDPTRRGGRRLRRALRLAGGVGLALCALVAIAKAHRLALYPVVLTCVLDAEKTGSPFPCLKVDVSEGEARGYAVLRRPVGRPDTILAPTRRIVGIEDPALQASDVPNYFALAWDQRRLAPNGDRAKDGAVAQALAVNSSLQREQDQLHIHIGCLYSRWRKALQSAAEASPVGRWTHATTPPGANIWIYRTGARDLRGTEPFRLAGEAFGAGRGLAAVTLLAAPLSLGGQVEFVLAAFSQQDLAADVGVSAEDLLDPRCAALGG